MQFKETFTDTERIKYNTNGIKTGSLKNIDLLKVQVNSVEQQIIVTKARNGKLLQTNMRNKIRHLEVLDNVCITIVC